MNDEWLWMMIREVTSKDDSVRKQHLTKNGNDNEYLRRIDNSFFESTSNHKHLDKLLSIIHNNKQQQQSSLQSFLYQLQQCKYCLIKICWFAVFHIVYWSYD